MAEASRFGRHFVCGCCQDDFTEEGACPSCGSNYVVEVSHYTNPLKEMIYEAIPFVGYAAHVPDIKQRLVDAVDFGKEEDPT